QELIEIARLDPHPARCREAQTAERAILIDATRTPRGVIQVQRQFIPPDPGQPAPLPHRTGVAHLLPDAPKWTAVRLDEPRLDARAHRQRAAARRAGPDVLAVDTILERRASGGRKAGDECVANADRGMRGEGVDQRRTHDDGVELADAFAAAKRGLERPTPRRAWITGLLKCGCKPHAFVGDRLAEGFGG